ncbi:MAG TPA: UDP-3-O-(3-hydroxymyristoyl)glucosamine N-acyltransferase [bacterium]|nr:UDP-3-O-(3-hydroxymyristoyl)glucosamine N-acyltransferase [bacterium]HPN42278.1 UDP-3-O-(3-hydroxymyristoyl)glucosamine N-acyltransferase [bacterium]
MALTVNEIAALLGGRVDGDGSVVINGLAKIEEAGPGNLSFIANPKYHKFIETTHAAAVLVEESFPQSDKTLIRCGNPYFSFLKMAQQFYKQAPQVAAGIHQTAIIDATCKQGKNLAIGAYVVTGANCSFGDNTIIHPGVVIGSDVQIGANSIVYANVTIREGCRIGNNVIIHSGAVIGADGFGFAFEGGKFHKLPQMGIVVLEDDVEIGANTTIDRATMGETIVKKGAKIDNLVQIAHNDYIGEHTVIAAQAGISGSTKIGNYVRIGGQAGLVGHIEVGNNAAIGAQGGVTKSIPENGFVSGYPARPHMTAKREEASLARLPEMLKEFKKLQAQIEKMSAILKIDQE